MTTKQCSKCLTERDILEFYNNTNKCKQCCKTQYAQRTEKQKEHTRKLARVQYRKNKERNREKYNEYMRTYVRTYDFLQGDGCCLYCWETNPFMLNNHHIWRRKNNDFTITLCEDHHAAFTRGMAFVLTKWAPNPIQG